METGDANCDPNDESASVVVVVPPNADECEAPESSNRDGDEGAGDRSSGGAVAKGISSVLVSVIKDFDCRAQDTLKSQDHLSSSIGRLTSELDRLLADAPSAFITQHAARISSVRNRVSSMNAVLGSIQRRLDNIDRMLSTASPPGGNNPLLMLKDIDGIFSSVNNSSPITRKPGTEFDNFEIVDASEYSLGSNNTKLELNQLVHVKHEVWDVKFSFLIQQDDSKVQRFENLNAFITYYGKGACRGCLA